MIFTTAYRDYAVDGFELNAVDYLLKPIFFERFFLAIQKFLEQEKKSISYDPPENTMHKKTDFVFVNKAKKTNKSTF